MQLPGIASLPASLFPPVAGLNGYNSAQPSGLSPQGPQALGGPSATGATFGGLPPASPFDMGSGVTNNFDTSTLSNVSPQILTPSNSPQQQFLSRQAGLPGGKLNYMC